MSFKGRDANLPFDPPEDAETVEVHFEVDEWDVTNYGSEQEAVSGASGRAVSGPGPDYAHIARWQYPATGESRFIIVIVQFESGFAAAFDYDPPESDSPTAVPFKYKTDDATNCVDYRIETDDPTEGGWVIIEMTHEQYEHNRQALSEMMGDE